MLGDLARNGFQVTEELEDSDAVIVNTCAFVEGAKTESLEVGLAGSTAASFSLSSTDDVFPVLLYLNSPGLIMHTQAILEAAQLKQDGRVRKVVVTGCLAQRYSQDLAGEESETPQPTTSLPGTPRLYQPERHAHCMQRACRRRTTLSALRTTAACRAH